jgi:hypothetical protein
MMPERVLHATGTITKEEDLINIEHSIMPDTLVLESSNPYPGYHGDNVPESLKPNDIYLVTRHKYDGEDILRKSRTVRHKLHDRFDTSFGHAAMSSGTYDFIRLKNLDCFECIDRIQKAFTGEGIVFCKKRKVSGNALIRIQRLYSFQKVSDHLYRNLANPLVHYFEIPCKPDWDFFRKITFYIRPNVGNYSFDSAIGAVYLENLHDIVRIFSTNLTVDQLEFIRSKYIYELDHPDHLECH